MPLLIPLVPVSRPRPFPFFSLCPSAAVPFCKKKHLGHPCWKLFPPGFSYPHFSPISRFAGECCPPGSRVKNLSVLLLPGSPPPHFFPTAIKQFRHFYGGFGLVLCGTSCASLVGVKDSFAPLHFQAQMIFLVFPGSSSLTGCLGFLLSAGPPVTRPHSASRDSESPFFPLRLPS